MQRYAASSNSHTTHYEGLRKKFKMKGIVHGAQSCSRYKFREHVCEAQSAVSLLHGCTTHEKHFEADYDLQETIGHGANALVRKCIRRKDERLFAVKVSQVEEEQLPGLQKLFNKLKMLIHPGMAPYRAMYINTNESLCYLVMDYIAHPTLNYFIYHGNKLETPLVETEIKGIMRQLFEVLSFLHVHNICHRDVKPENILYDRLQRKIWLIDFGVSKLMSEKNITKIMMTNTGTCEYKAPEIYEGGRYTESVDLWAAGVILYEMVEKHHPFSRQYLSDSIQSIVHIEYEEGEAWRNVSRHARDLLRRLLKPAVKRLTADAALKSFWLNQERNRPLLSTVSSITLSTTERMKQAIEVSNPPLTPKTPPRRHSQPKKELGDWMSTQEPSTPSPRKSPSRTARGSQIRSDRTDD